jgi:hypothetical protein
MAERRFPPPWIVEDLGTCFVERDSAWQKPAYVYGGLEAQCEGVSSRYLNTLALATGNG